MFRSVLCDAPRGLRGASNLLRLTMIEIFNFLLVVHMVPRQGDAGVQQFVAHPAPLLAGNVMRKFGKMGELPRPRRRSKATRRYGKSKIKTQRRPSMRQSLTPTDKHLAKLPKTAQTGFSPPSTGRPDDA